MLPGLERHPVPDWLKRFDPNNDHLPIFELLRGSVFYPASSMDGRPVKYLGGYCHSFVYADCNVSQETLAEYLDTFKGYRLYHSRTVKRDELCSREFQAILPGPSDGNPRNLHVSIVPYALWAIYNRLPEFDESHGPERFSLLFVGGEGAATFQSLYYSNECAPSVIVLIKCDAFTGNWTSFYSPNTIFSRSVIQNPCGVPAYLFCERGPPPPWPWYSKLQNTVVSVLNYDGATHQRLHLWGKN